jgi:hypothetical protein
VPEGLVLDPTAYLVDHSVRGAHDVEGIGHVEPDEAGGTPEARQIPDVDAPALLGQGPHAAAVTSDDVGRGLDRDARLDGLSLTLSTRKPSSPSSASVRPVAPLIVRGLLRCRGGT